MLKTVAGAPFLVGLKYVFQTNTDNIPDIKKVQMLDFIIGMQYEQFQMIVDINYKVNHLLSSQGSDPARLSSKHVFEKRGARMASQSRKRSLSSERTKELAAQKKTTLGAKERSSELDRSMASGYIDT